MAMFNSYVNLPEGILNLVEICPLLEEVDGCLLQPFGTPSLTGGDLGKMMSRMD